MVTPTGSGDAPPKSENAIVSSIKGENKPSPGNGETKSPSWLKKKFADGTYIVYFLWFFSGYILLTGIIICLSGVAHGDQKPTFDYCSFAFPCMAGIIAGLGVYLEDNAEMLYGISCVLLAVSLLCYMRAHEIGGVAIGGAIVLFLAVLVAIILEMSFSRWQRNWRSLEFNITRIVAIIFLVVVVAVGADIITWVAKN